jgi:hypothetical protein
MTPLEFVSDCGGHHNDPVGAVMEALKKPLVIRSGNGEDAEWEVLSYYYDKKAKRMVIDIEPKGI